MSDPINTAEIAIARILSQFERETGDLVEGVRLDRMDITRTDDRHPRHGIHVVLEVRRRPGHEWLGV